MPMPRWGTYRTTGLAGQEPHLRRRNEHVRLHRILIPSLVLIATGVFWGQISPTARGHALRVRVFMVRDLLTGGLDPVSADVVFRKADGEVTFSGTTDQSGHISVPVEARGVRSGERIEATIGSGSPLYFGAIVG